MPQAAIFGALTGGASLVGGLLNRGQKSTQQQTSTTTRNLSPEQQQLMAALGQSIQGRLANPEAGIAPLRTAARTRINRTARAAGSSLDAQLASRGYNDTGLQASGRGQIEAGRVGAFGDLEGQLADLILKRQDSTSDLATRLLNVNLGETTIGSGTQTQPGNVAGGALGGGLSTLTTLLTLDKLMKGGGGGLFGGGGGGGGFSGFGGDGYSSYEE